MALSHDMMATSMWHSTSEIYFMVSASVASVFDIFFVFHQALADLNPLNDLLAKIQQEELIITATCQADTGAKFADKSKTAIAEVEELRLGVERLANQLSLCSSLWDRHTASSDNVSSKLTDLEERLRLDFKLQPSLEQKTTQVIKAEVRFLSQYTKSLTILVD